MVEKIHHIVLNEREIVKMLSISIERVHHILHDALDMRVLSAWLVPLLLTNDQKRKQMLIAEALLKRTTKILVTIFADLSL